MITLLTAVHVVVAILIVIVVLLQSGKGGGLGAGFGGGGSNTLFGSTGGSNFFTRFTIGLALALTVTSLSLTMLKSRSLKRSIFDGAAPTETSAPAVPVDSTEKK